MTKLNLILTFDYELPLGGCVSYQKGIFEPTEALLVLAKKKKIKIVLFADVCSVLTSVKTDTTYR